MKVNWDKLLTTFFERTAGIPLPEIGENINSVEDLKEALQYFAVAANPKIAQNILHAVFEECEELSLTRLNEEYEGWVRELKNDPDTLKRVISVCDYLADYDAKTSARFYNTHVLWGANLQDGLEEHSFADSARLIDYAHKALEQGAPEASTKCIFELYHSGKQQDYSTQAQQELEDLFTKSLIAFIDTDQQSAQNWLDDERGVGGPESAYEVAYYKAMTHLAQKARTSIRPAA